MTDFAPNAENAILGIIRRIEEEISQRKEALVHLQKAAQLIGLPLTGVEGHQPAPPEEPTSTSGFQIPVAVRVDEFIDRLEPNQEFSLEDVVQFVGEAGLEVTEKLRANVSSALSRRKDKTIESIVRGQFKKIGFATIPTEQPDDANNYSLQRALIVGEREKEKSLEEM